MRDLPKCIPPAVLSAAEEALRDSDRLVGTLPGREAAKAAYDRMRQPRTDPQAQAALDQAQALIDWGAMLQRELPTLRLHNRFWRSAAAHAPCVSVIVAEIPVPSRACMPGGSLKTELTLTLNPEEGVFRHDEWLNGYRVTGGGLLNTAIGLRAALQPETLARIHEDVAEGRNWPHLANAFGRLVEALKDR